MELYDVLKVQSHAQTDEGRERNAVHSEGWLKPAVYGEAGTLRWSGSGIEVGMAESNLQYLFYEWPSGSVG